MTSRPRHQAVPMQLVIEPVLHVNAKTVRIPRTAWKTSLAALCRRAGVQLRATTLPRTLYVRRSSRQVRTYHYDLIGVPCAPRTKLGALRALEALAYSFFDHGARSCICFQGYFLPPVPPKRRPHVKKSDKGS